MVAKIRGEEANADAITARLMATRLGRFAAFDSAVHPREILHDLAIVFTLIRNVKTSRDGSVGGVDHDTGVDQVSDSMGKSITPSAKLFDRIVDHGQGVCTQD